MKNELALIQRGLVTTEFVPDLTDSTLDQMIQKAFDDSEVSRMLMENFNHQVIMAVHLESSKQPVLTAKLNAVKNRLQGLMGMAATPDGVNPITGQFQELTPQPAGVEEDEPPDPLMTPLKARCKDLFRKLTKLTHPDRTTDSNLRELFHTVRAAMKMLDAPMLEQLLVSVNAYKESRKSKEEFRKIKLRALKTKRQVSDHYQSEYMGMKSSLVGRIVLEPPENKAEAFRFYAETVIENLQIEINKQEAILRFQNGMSKNPWATRFTQT